MSSRVLIVSLVALTFTGLVCAEEFHDKKNHLSARFPGTVKTVDNQEQAGVRLTLHVSSNAGVVYIAGSMTVAKERAEPRQLKEMVIPYLAGVDSKLKNMRALKQGETKLHEKSLPGYWYLVQHDAGYQIHWITIENGKLYMVTVSAKEEASLWTQEVKKFLESITISGEGM